MTISSLANSNHAVALHLAGGGAFACLDRISPAGTDHLLRTDLPFVQRVRHFFGARGLLGKGVQ